MPIDDKPLHTRRRSVLALLVVAGLASGIGLAVAQLVVTRVPIADDESEGEANMPERRRRAFDDERAFPFGQIPEGALERAWVDRRSAVVRRGRLAPQATGFEWKSLGPAPDQLAPRQLTGRVRPIVSI